MEEVTHLPPPVLLCSEHHMCISYEKVWDNKGGENMATCEHTFIEDGPHFLPTSCEDEWQDAATEAVWGWGWQHISK